MQPNFFCSKNYQEFEHKEFKSLCRIFISIIIDYVDLIKESKISSYNGNKMNISEWK